MRQYIIRRVLISIVILFGVSIILYTLIRVMPGDYILTLTVNNPKVTPEMVASLEKIYGLDTTVAQGYIRWISSALKGDFGESFIYKTPVTQVLSQRMWVSFSLALPAFIIQLLIGIPLGVISATRQYSKLDYALTAFVFVGISMPSFFFAALLQRVFAVWLGVLPLSGMVDARKSYQGFALTLDKARHYILPIMVLSITSMGVWMRYARSNMLDVLHSDYIRTARAKGLSESRVIYSHAFSNTLIPIVTLVGLYLPGLFSGAMITERVFAIQGIGYAGFDALIKGDIPFVMAFFMFLAVLAVLGTLLSDIFYAVVDPRVRLS